MKQYEMRMPDLSTTTSEVRVIRWLVEPGNEVKRGQSILEVETDKATMEVECAVDGIVVSIHAASDENVPVGNVIAILETADE